MRNKYQFNFFTFIVILFFLLASFNGICSVDNEEIKTYKNNFIDFNEYRYFSFVPTDMLSPHGFYRETFQPLVTELLEDRNYKFVENSKNADFVIILSSSNRYEELTVEIPVYIPGRKIRIPFEALRSMHNPDGNQDDQHHIPAIPYVTLPGDWDHRKVKIKSYSPSVSITCIGDIESNPVIIWQGRGIRSVKKSDPEKYGKELIEEIMIEFPEIPEKMTEEHTLLETGEKSGNEIENLLNQLTNK